ncbi:MAG: hypothetical protein IKB34_00630 [Clostridia bacterium]|nr:hypothetical protein [Clostridia bacterium]
MATYYIDNVNGNDSYSGLSALRPKKSYEKIKIIPGDIILFRRGSFYREKLNITMGTDVDPITYGAYGEGEAPTFCGSTDVSAAEDWEPTETPNVWRCVKPVPGDVGNFVFNGDECTATLRWEKDLLSAQGDFYDSRFAEGEQFRKRYTEQNVFMYSEKNPAEHYSHIEALSYNTRSLGTLCSNIVIQDLRFTGSGVHGLAGNGKNVVIRGCSFENIGGCAWNAALRIRFGNAVEFWQYGENILIEGCSFKNVYDSCVTHQGPGEKTVPTSNFICRRNLFDTYGMAAFEYRDKLPICSEFTANICKNAGCGFAMLGEELPRRSEIWPQPMGHHIFLWRIPEASAEGSLLIADNVFGEAPVGAAIYSIISPEAEAQITLRGNRYTKNSTLLNRFGGIDFNSLDQYKKKTGKDADSSYID